MSKTKSNVRFCEPEAEQGQAFKRGYDWGKNSHKISDKADAKYCANHLQLTVELLRELGSQLVKGEITRKRAIALWQKLYLDRLYTLQAHTPEDEMAYLELESQLAQELGCDFEDFEAACCKKERIGKLVGELCPRTGNVVFRRE
jgi:hypothetical protein